MGPVTVTIRTGPQKSKYSKPDAPKPDYCGLTIAGVEYSYSLDTQACAEFITQHKGQTLTVVAEGSKGEEKLVHVGAPATQMQQPPAQQPHPATPTHHAPPPPPEPKQPKDETAALKDFIARNRVLAVYALEAAFHTKREFETAKQWEMPDCTFTAIYTSCLFVSNQCGFGGSNSGIPRDAKFKPATQPTA